MTELRLERCDPCERADQIYDLFARNGRPEFGGVFERVYRPRAAAGLRSWIGLVGDRVVTHISVSPQAFSDGRRTLQGGVLGDLMADEAYRDFWTPVRLVRTMVGDLRRDGHLDFLYTTTNPESDSLFRAAAFQRFGGLRRYVFPLYLPYLLLARLRSGARRRSIAARPLDDPELTATLSALGSPGYWRPAAGPEFYSTRIPRESFPEGVWLRIAGYGVPAAPGWALVSPQARKGVIELADVLWPSGEDDLTGILHAVATWCRGEGFRRLSMSTFEGSRAARVVTGAGFIPRADVMGTLILPLRTPEALPPLEDWFVTSFVSTAW